MSPMPQLCFRDSMRSPKRQWPMRVWRRLAQHRLRCNPIASGALCPVARVSTCANRSSVHCCPTALPMSVRSSLIFGKFLERLRGPRVSRCGADARLRPRLGARAARVRAQTSALPTERCTSFRVCRHLVARARVAALATSDHPQGYSQRRRRARFGLCAAARGSQFGPDPDQQRTRSPGTRSTIATTSAHSCTTS